MRARPAALVGPLAAAWGAEQAAGAAVALAAARDVLDVLKAAAARAAQDDPRAGPRARAARFSVEFDGVRWALCRGGRGAFAEMALAGVELRNLRNADSSGAPPHARQRASATVCVRPGRARGGCAAGGARPALRHRRVPAKRIAAIYFFFSETST